MAKWIETKNILEPKRVKMIWKPLVLVVTSLGLAVCSPSLAAKKTMPEEFAARGVKVFDGDSFIVSTPAGTKEIRLFGIDCPERYQPFSNRAKKYTNSKVYRQQLLLQPIEKDRYQRTIAIVYRDKEALNGQLVEKGLAWVSPRYCIKEVCKDWKEKERRAQKAGLGIWSQKDPEPPWIFKKRQHKGSH